MKSAQEYVIHDGITILIVVEAESVSLASIRARRNTTLPGTIEITPLSQFVEFTVDDTEAKEALRVARKHWYERKVKGIRERIQQDQKEMKKALKTLQGLLDAK